MGLLQGCGHLCHCLLSLPVAVALTWLDLLGTSRRFQAGATLYVSGVDVVNGSAVPDAKIVERERELLLSASFDCPVSGVPQRSYLILLPVAGKIPVSKNSHFRPHPSAVEIMVL